MFLYLSLPIISYFSKNKFWAQISFARAWLFLTHRESSDEIIRRPFVGTFAVHYLPLFLRRFRECGNELTHMVCVILLGSNNSSGSSSRGSRPASRTGGRAACTRRWWCRRRRSSPPTAPAATSAVEAAAEAARRPRAAWAARRAPTAWCTTENTRSSSSPCSTSGTAPKSEYQNFFIIGLWKSGISGPDK